jgi:shikimate 5-dehydrogenase
MNDGNSRPKTADIVSLGAGGMGASIPFHLAKRNAGMLHDSRRDARATTTKEHT